MKFLLTLLALASSVFAQSTTCNINGGNGIGGGAPDSTSSSSTIVSAAAATTTGGSVMHTVNIAGGSLVFSPDTITAAVGDQVQFIFAGGNHTVTQSSYDKPCNPLAGGFSSGFTGSTTTHFTVTVRDTNPVWFYCALARHCQSGQVGVINPPSSGNNLAAYKAAAAMASSTNATSAAGGVLSVQGAAATTLATAGNVTSTSMIITTTRANATASATPSSNGVDGLRGAERGVRALMGLVGMAAFMI